MKHPAVPDRCCRVRRMQDERPEHKRVPRASAADYGRYVAGKLADLSFGKSAEPMRSWYHPQGAMFSLTWIEVNPQGDHVLHDFEGRLGVMYASLK